MIQVKNKFDTRRFILALLAFIAGGAVPIQLVTLSFGYAQIVKGIPKGKEMMATAHDFALDYLFYIYIPALIALFIIALYSRKKYPDLFRRITIGFGFGALATFMLDSIRQVGVIYNFLPDDTLKMFGKLLTLGDEFEEFWFAGLAVHLLNGANFGLFYAFVFGKQNSYTSAVFWAILWGLVVETMMMNTPPMAPIVGPFGIDFAWPELFLVTLVAHIFFALTFGLLIQHFLKEEDKGWLWTFLVKKSQYKRKEIA